MQIQSLTRSFEKAQVDLKVVFAAESNSGGVSVKTDDTEAKDLIKHAASNKVFSGKPLKSKYFALAMGDQSQDLLAIGLGSKKDTDAEMLRKAGATIYKAAASERVSSVAIDFDSAPLKPDDTAALQALAEGLVMASYKFDKLKSKKSDDDSVEIDSVDVYVSSKFKGAAQALKDGVILGECVNFSHYLGDAPGNYMTPPMLAKEVQKAAKGTDLKVTIWNKERIAKEKMGGLIGVNLGSHEEPRFIVMEYNGAAKSKKPACFVGKGLTFDAGGISIKPGAGMQEMKYDMCGGANVIGAMLAIARLKLKTNAVGYVPSTDNLLGPKANKPGDVLTFRNGKTAEVNNTDAEGRLILADALSYASEKKPAFIVDAATLTGAMLIALGNIHTGVFNRDKDLQAKIEKAAKVSGEKIWPMPLDPEHTKDIKGTFADLSNIGATRGAGSATAAAFLNEFVEESIPWAHFDIAGTAWNAGNRLPYNPKAGATGSMVRTFVELSKLV